MKKVFLMAAAALLSMSVSAQKYVVWSGDELAADEEQLPVDWYGWWNMANPTIDDATSEEGKSIFWHSDNGTPPCSAGVYIGDNGHTFDMSKLAAMDLVFNAKRTDSGTWVLRLTGNNSGDVDYALNGIPSDGEWHEVRLNIKDCFPKIYDTWMKAASDESYWKGYVFALVGDGQDGTTGFYTSNIRYEASVAMPDITLGVADITSTSATVSYAVEFPAGYTNTKVTVNGEEAAASGVLSLTGLQPKTEYTYKVVATGELGGKTYSAEKVITFSTLRELGDVPVWYGQIDGVTTQYGSKYNVHVDYNIAYNSDKTLTVYAEFNGFDGVVGLADRLISFVRGLVEEWASMTAEGDGYTFTTTKTVEEDTEVEFFFWLPYAEGVFGGDYHQIYKAGSSNEAPVMAPRVKASAQNVTFNSAEIAYTLTVPASLEGADVTVYYKSEDGEAKAAEASPIVLTGLTEHTAYTYEVYAVAVMGDDTYESAHETVTFATTYENAVDKVYADYAKAVLKNAYLIGEDASLARTFYVSLPFTITYSAQGTGRYEIDLAQIANVVGLNPQIWSNGFRQLTKGEGDVYYYDFGAQEENAVVPISHYLAYAGGVYDYRCEYTSWGLEKELPELGAPEKLTLAASKNIVKIEEPVILTTSATDAAGYYLSVDAVQFDIPEGVTVANGVAKVTGPKGAYKIVASAEGLEASVELQAVCSPEATDLASGVVGATDEENLIEGTTAANATDGKLDTELRWGCAETENHYLTLDLGESSIGEGYFIEAVDIVFEGAYATDFTVTLTNNGPAEAPARVLASEPSADKVFTVTGGNTTHHTFTQDPNGTHRYVTIATSKALNAGWGIKIKEVQVFGTVHEPSFTGIESVAVSGETATDVYNLMGVRVLSGVNATDAQRSLAPGLYIIGGKKVLVK